jgi:hypothetical protein
MRPDGRLIDKKKLGRLNSFLAPLSARSWPGPAPNPLGKRTGEPPAPRIASLSLGGRPNGLIE